MNNGCSFLSLIINTLEQNVIDCSQKYGNQGSNGGTMDNSLDIRLCF